MDGTIVPSPLMIIDVELSEPNGEGLRHEPSTSNSEGENAWSGTTTRATLQKANTSYFCDVRSNYNEQNSYFYPNLEPNKPVHIPLKYRKTGQVHHKPLLAQALHFHHRPSLFPLNFDLNKLGWVIIWGGSFTKFKTYQVLNTSL